MTRRLALRVGAGAAFALLSACATLRQPLGTHTWNDVCYGALRQDVVHLAGADAYDCGLLRLAAQQGDQAQITACARDALASGRAFRFGYQSMGDDSLYCDVALRTTDGQLWRLYFDGDVTGQYGRNGDHSAISLSRCKSLAFEPGTIGYGSFFDLRGCEKAPEAAQALAAQRTPR